jgi:cell division protein FtsA
MPEHIVAIDLGTTKVVSIVGERSEKGRYKILAYSEAASTGIRYGQVENVENVISAIIPTLADVKAKTGIDRVERIYVGIAGQCITCIENRTETVRDKYDELISKEEIKDLEVSAGKLHLNKGEEILHVIPQSYTIDGTEGITDPVGRLGSKVTGHFHVIIGNEKNRIHIETCMRKLDLSIQKLFLESIASAKAILSDDEKEMGVAMIDMGGGTTDLIVYEEGIIKHTAVIPFGGNSITNDIKTGCSILFSQAEKAKIKFGILLKNNEEYLKVDGISGRPPQYIYIRTISDIIKIRLDEIMMMVMSEIDRAKCRKLNAGIVITGGVSKMNNIKKYLEEKTGMPVKTGYPDYLSSDSPQEIIHPKYSTAVGLIMCGFENLENDHTQPLPKPASTEQLQPQSPLQPKPPIKQWAEKTWQACKHAIKVFMNPQPEENND